MSISVNYDGLKVNEIVTLAGMVEEGKTAQEINKAFPGRATEIEEAEAEPHLQVAVMFSVTADTDLESLLAEINTLLEAGDLPGDADWVELLSGDDEAGV